MSQVIGFITEAIETVEEAKVLFVDVKACDYEGADLIDVMIGKLLEAKESLTGLKDGKYTTKVSVNKAVALHRGDLFTLRDAVQVLRADFMASKEDAAAGCAKASAESLKAKKIAAMKKLQEEIDAMEGIEEV